jgi:D-3-phosphoglycerate dehydrogenase
MLGISGVVCIPHLGASTPESEENCARMAAAQLRDYLETGTIRNSVNMPEIVLPGQPEGCRILLIHDNVPNMVSNMSAAISREGININNMLNKSRQEMAVTVMELSQVPTEELIAELNQQPGVIKVRYWH